ncbi:MAG: orotidine-5'-phosphate decarboxylase [Dehalococcoidales bacterium]|nr:orotidine-5'-phosphate decarboxylase [Dehalococcoidales bacterium]
MNFKEKLLSISRKNNSLVCVGLDTDPDLMPEKISVFDFNKAVIDATSDLVCAYKPNLAFYEAMGDAGLEALKRTVKYVPSGIPVIADAKRGDIGNTSRAYAKALFDIQGFDAATVNPYLGFDAIEPFLEYRDKGIIILCRTSNAGARDFQSLPCQTSSGLRPLFEIVAEKAGEWNKNGNIGLVVGATYPDELKIIRRMHPEMPLLIPGIGVQGGDVATTVKNGTSPQGEMAIINSSRGIIHASRGADFAEAARESALKLREEINRWRNKVQ